MDWRKWVTRVLITALPLAACATPAMTLTRQGEATISDATLSADGRTVTVTIRGGASPSSGAVCAGNYRLQDYEITATFSRLMGGRRNTNGSTRQDVL